MKTALFLGAGASVFAGQPTTKELIERVRERMKARGHKPHGDEGSQNYIMRVINNDIVGIINNRTNFSCGV